MIFKREKKIINTGSHLGKPTMEDEAQMIHEYESIVPPLVYQQSREKNTVLYGGRGVNLLVGNNFSRPSHDFDIKSTRPKHHAIDLERRIDNHMKCDIAYVIETRYQENGVKPLFRVKTRPLGDPDADYSHKPSGMRFVEKKGIRIEPLSIAKKKYHRMITGDNLKRYFQGHLDLWRIDDYTAFNVIEKRFKQRGLW